MTRPRKKPRCKRDSNPGSYALEEDALTARPTRRWERGDNGRWAVINVILILLHGEGQTGSEENFTSFMTRVKGDNG